MATKARNTKSAFLLPPYKGVDFRIPIPLMPPEYSPFMVNFLAENGIIKKRPPHTAVLTIANTSSSTPICIPYFNGTTEKVISVGSSKTEDSLATTPTNTPATVLPPYHDWLIYQNTIFVAGNGVVSSLNPTTLAWASTFTFTAASTTTQRKPIVDYRERVYVGDKFNLYYGGVGAVSGAMTAFNVGSLMNGVGIIGMGVLNLSNGFSPEKFLVLVSNLGEVLVYSGSYPGALDWYLVNKFKVEIPYGTSSDFPVEVINIPGDVLISAKFGHQIYSVRELLESNSGTTYEPFEPIRPLWQTAIPFDNGLPYIGSKTIGYIAQKNSLIIVAELQTEGIPAFGLAGTAQGSAWGIEFDGSTENFYQMLFMIDLGTGICSMHTMPVNNLAPFAVSQIRTLPANAYMPYAFGGAGGSKHIFYRLLSEIDPPNTGYGTFNSTAVLSPNVNLGFANKAIKNLVLYSNLISTHSIKYAIVKNFSKIIPTTLTSVATAATSSTGFNALPGYNVVNPINILIRDIGSQFPPFEYYGMNAIYEEGGNF